MQHITLKLFTALLFLLPALSHNMSIAADNEHHMVGDIVPDTGRYTAIDKSFSITLPVKGTKKYLASVITDTMSGRGSTIVIEPRKNAGIYQLEISNALIENERSISFSEASAKTFDWYRRLISHSYNEKLIGLISQEFEINGRQAATATYKQASNNTKGPRFHLLYLVDFGDKLVFLWADIPLEQDDLEIEDKIISGKAEQSLKSIAMLRSLVFN